MAASSEGMLREGTDVEESKPTCSAPAAPAKWGSADKAWWNSMYSLGKGDTSLHRACHAGDEAAVQALIDAARDASDVHAAREALNAVDSMGRTAVHHAAYSGHADVLSRLAECELVTTFGARDARGCTAVWCAAVGNHVAALEVLTSDAMAARVGDLNTENLESAHEHPGGLVLGYSPLWMAAYLGHLDAVKVLTHARIASRVDVNRPSADGMTPLAAAAYKGRLGCVQHFIEDEGLSGRVDLSVEPAGNLSNAVCAATWCGSTEVFEYLIRQPILSPSLTTLNFREQPLLHMVLAFEPLDGGSAAASASMFNTLMGTGSFVTLEDLCPRDADDNTPLHIAAMHGVLPAVQALCAMDAVDVNARNDANETALHLSCAAGHVDVARALLLCGRVTWKESEVGALALLCCDSVKKTGKIDIVRFMVEESPLCADEASRTLLLNSGVVGAISAGSVELLKYLHGVGGYDRSWFVSNADWARAKMLRALAQGHRAVVAEGLEMIGPCGIDESRLCATTFAANAFVSGSVATVEFALGQECASQAMLDSSAGTMWLQSPLLCTCRSGSIELLRWLLKNEALREAVVLSVEHVKGKLLWKAVCDHPETGPDMIRCLADSPLVGTEALRCGQGGMNTSLVLLARKDSAAALSFALWILEEARWAHEAAVDSRVWSEAVATVMFSACRVGDVNALERLQHVVVDDGVMDRPRSIVDSNGYSLLHVACQWGSLSVVRWLCALETVDLNCKEKSGRTPFACACEANRLAVVRYLLEDPLTRDVVDPELPNNSGCTPFYAACFAGSLSVVMYLARGSLVDIAADSESTTPFTIAATYDKVPVVQYLLRHHFAEAQPLQTTKAGDTCCGLAAYGGHVDVLRVLAAYPELHVLFAAPNHRGITPLMLAAAYGQMDAVRFLCEDCEELLDPDATSETGDSALLLACHQQRIPVVKYLSLSEKVAGRVDITRVNQNGINLVLAVCQAGCLELIKFFAEHPGVRDRVEFGRASHAGVTPFSITLQCGHLDVLRYMLTSPFLRSRIPKGALPGGIAPLYEAVYYRKHLVVDLLLAYANRYPSDFGTAREAVMADVRQSGSMLRVVTHKLASPDTPLDTYMLLIMTYHLGGPETLSDRHGAITRGLPKPSIALDTLKEYERHGGARAVQLIMRKRKWQAEIERLGPLALHFTALRQAPVLLAEYFEMRRRRSSGVPQQKGGPLLSLWGRLPKQCFAEVLLQLSSRAVVDK